MKNYKIILFILLLLSGSVVGAGAQSGRVYSLNTGDGNAIWHIYPYAGEGSVGVADRSIVAGEWVLSTVPGTVFTDYVNAGIEEDPNFGDNIYRVDKDKYNQSYWYCGEFTLPRDLDATKQRIWLNFDGINRVGQIFLNGTELGELRGMMQRGRYDVTRLVESRGPNILKVLVSVPNQKRHPEEKFANLASPTYLSSAGWDWMPSVPGLNSGITDKVYLTVTGEISVTDPWIRTPLSDNNQIADLELSASIGNNSKVARKVKVSVEINPGNITFSREFNLQGGEEQDVVFNSRNVAQLRMENPQLWWPNGLGEPNLYECRITVADGENISDSKNFRFGIREYGYHTAMNNVFHVYVNGHKVFLKGGNWGMSEYLLRCRGDEYDTKVLLHREMNFNCIRNWMGSTTDREFYEACDKYGIMIWDDFWLNSKFDVPEFPEDFNANAIEKIKRFRNHASLMMWCGENEGVPGRYDGGEDLNANLSRFVSIYDGGDRHYQPDSRRGGGLSGSGLWKNFRPSEYFADASFSFMGDKYPKGLSWGMRSEIGTAVFTTFESFREFIPKEQWWPNNEMWNKHFFGPLAKNGGPDVYERSIVERYGEPEGIEDFCEKAQLLNIETNKAMYEAWGDHLWDDASGILIWMSQSAYPSFVWQTYDYYYDLTGAYWGARKGCEHLHIQWNSNDNTIKVVNTTLDDHKELTASAAIYNIDGRKVDEFSRSAKVNAAANSATGCFSILDDDMAMGKEVVASASGKGGEASNATTAPLHKAWNTDITGDDWIYVDLGDIVDIGNVRLVWQNGKHASSYALSVSDNLKKWNRVYTESGGDGSTDNISFAPVKARYVKLQCLAGDTQGYGVSRFEVRPAERQGLTDVNFLRLTLKNKEGKTVSSNEYWFGDNENDYRQLNTLPEAELAYYVSRREVKEGKYYLDLKITNRSQTPAFALRARLVDKETDRRILPALMNTNYITLMPGEVRYIYFEFDDEQFKGTVPQPKVKQYGHPEQSIH